MTAMPAWAPCRSIPRAFALLACLLGCAPSLSTFQTAAVPPTGHVSAAVGLEGSLPLGGLSDAYDKGSDVLDKAASGQTLTSAEKWSAFDAGISLLLSPPSIGNHLSLAYVPWRRLEISLRYAGSALRVASRYQVLDRGQAPFDLSVGLGVSRFTYAFPFADKVPILKLDDFTRWQLDVPVLIGLQNDWFRAWIGPRLVATFFDSVLLLDLKVEQAVLASMSGHAYYLGGQGGVGLGYRWLFVAFELTITGVMGRATLEAPAIPDAPTHSAELSGLVVYPTLGLQGEF
jgi:hypothetical protein